MRRVAKVDANQPEIVAAFRKVGASVLHLHQVGSGCPDILIGYHGFNILVEIKDGSKPPSERRLTEDEEVFFDNWIGKIYIIENITQVLNLIALINSWKGTYK